MATVGVGGVDAFGADVVQALEVGVEDDLLLVGVPQWFATGDGGPRAAGQGARDGGGSKPFRIVYESCIWKGMRKPV